MPPNPFSDGLSIQVNAETAQAQRGLSGLIDSIGGARTAALAFGGALAAVAAGGLAKAIQAAAEWEERMVDVAKVTSEATAAELSENLQEMATEMPVAAEQLARISEQAGRLGIQGTNNIQRFTRVTAEIAVATDLAESEAADSFARIATLTDTPISNIRMLGDVVNELSNTMAASASEITNAMTRSAGALSQLGVGTSDIVALNAAMNEVSTSSRIAGTRLRRFAQELLDPDRAEKLADALGMTTDEFITMREESPVELITRLAESFREGGSEAEELRRVMGRTARATLASLAKNLDGLRRAQERANEQTREGGSLTREYEKASSTFNSEVQRLQNSVGNLAREIGEELLPVMGRLVGRTADVINIYDDLIERSKNLEQQDPWRVWLFQAARAETASREAGDAAEALQSKMANALTENDVARFRALNNEYVAMEDRARSAGDAAEDAGERSATAWSSAKNSVEGFMQSLSELREGAVGGLTISRIEEMVRNRLPELLEEGRQEGGLSGRRANLLNALLDAAERLNIDPETGRRRRTEEGERVEPDIERITQLPEQTATALAAAIGRGRRRENLFRTQIARNLRETGLFGARGTRPERLLSGGPRSGLGRGPVIDASFEVTVEGDTSVIEDVAIDAVSGAFVSREERLLRTSSRVS